MVGGNAIENIFFKPARFDDLPGLASSEKGAFIVTIMAVWDRKRRILVYFARSGAERNPQLTDTVFLGLDGLGLQTLESQVLEMRLVIPLEVCIG